MKKNKSNLGITLAEIMIVVAILAILLTAFLLSYRGQLRKGYDGERKSDIHEIKTAFEEYFNDTGCYPIGTALMAFTYCNESVDPWLRKVPCDPETGEPYTITVQPSACPTWYAIYTNVMQTSSEAENNPCSDPYCRVAEIDYNYGVSSGNISLSDAIGGITGEYEFSENNICYADRLFFIFTDNCQATIGDIDRCESHRCYKIFGCDDEEFRCWVFR